MVDIEVRKYVDTEKRMIPQKLPERKSAPLEMRRLEVVMNPAPVSLYTQGEEGEIHYMFPTNGFVSDLAVCIDYMENGISAIVRVTKQSIIDGPLADAGATYGLVVPSNRTMKTRDRFDVLAGDRFTVSIDSVKKRKVAEPVIVGGLWLSFMFNPDPNIVRNRYHASTDKENEEEAVSRFDAWWNESEIYNALEGPKAKKTARRD